MTPHQIIVEGSNVQYSHKRSASAFAVFLLFFLVFGLCARSLLCVHGVDEFSLRVDEADDALQKAFTRVLEAENGGANVSDLVAELNDAGGLLAKARVSYLNGNLSEAAGEAELAFSMAKTIEADAASLRGFALADGQGALWQALMFSTVGAAVFLVVSFLVWRWFKRVYARRLLDMRPEVSSDVEA